MIERYSRPEMKEIWSSQEKYNIWFKIEAFACEAMAELGKIPKDSVKNIWNKGKVDPSKIDEIEKITKHDVIAFLTNVAENVGKDSRFIHNGVTSSDILDTCLSVQLKQSLKIITKELKGLVTELRKIAIVHKKTLCIGRSHGIYAEPTTFGLKMLGKYCEFNRSYERLKKAEQEISICAISGAVGTFANIEPNIQDYVAKKLKLKSEDVSTQIIPRDRHAYLFSILGVLASSIENLAIEIRHLQRSEVREAEEFFSSKQKGSSAMPHKRNPVLTENLTGIARLIRGNVLPSLENVALWHERDISHSSVERIICPETLILTDFSLNRMTSVIKNLVVNKSRMLENLKKTRGLYNSQRVLLKLIEKGLSREVAYRIVQKTAMLSWEKEQEFEDLLKHNKSVIEKININELREIFDINYHVRNIEKIYKKVLKK